MALHVASQEKSAFMKALPIDTLSSLLFLLFHSIISDTDLRVVQLIYIYCFLSFLGSPVLFEMDQNGSSRLMLMMLLF